MTSMVALLDRNLAIVAEFSDLTSWEERYRRLIEIGRAMPGLPASEQTDAAKVRGCSSSVWLHADLVEGRLRLRADSDALIARGLVALVLRLYDGSSPAEACAAEPLFIEELELTQHLSASRANGLAAMVARIRQLAAAFAA